MLVNLVHPGHLRSREEPRYPVGADHAVAECFSEGAAESEHAVCGGFRSRLRGAADRGGEFRCQMFVRVEVEHPRRVGCREAEVPLSRKVICPGPVDHPGTGFFRHFHCPVRTAAVDQNHFVRTLPGALYGFRNILFFILCEDQYSKIIHGDTAGPNVG